MKTENMEKAYQKIANTLNSMIPEEWSRVLLYAEIREGYAHIFFYYYPIQSKQPVYSLKIEENFTIDIQSYNELENLLYDYCEELWNEFGVQQQEQWTSLTFILKNNGKMNIHYQYDDLSQIDPTSKRKQWEEKYLQ
ncbi:immunity protein YezG family protein [Heyndrickxia acidiproducens]|uniref:immunity protein YezG family protein n=1 Tax=Heyndrickxia acidiproducens TaxID=1121084 RepID=UPI000365C92F|nr:immunity protein YezG family protein [Heyndrickxia acidiproducens]